MHKQRTTSHKTHILFCELKIQYIMKYDETGALNNDFIQREITPISEEDLFIVLNHPEADFEYSTHFHSDFELNLVLDTYGKRIVGDSIENFSSCDLILIGPNIPHAWRGETIKGNHVITIQFHDKLLDFPLLSKKVFSPIKELLQKASRGIQFVEEKDSKICNRIMNISNMSGFNVSLEFFSLLYELSTSPNQRYLASVAYDTDLIIRESKSRRISVICEYIKYNYMNQIKLSDIASQINMSDSAVSHFFKKRTSRNIIDYINDIRVGHATRMLYETTHSISEVAFLCGFNNISNFNRQFKKAKGQTPSIFREGIQKILVKY